MNVNKNKQFLITLGLTPAFLGFMCFWLYSDYAGSDGASLLIWAGIGAIAISVLALWLLYKIDKYQKRTAAELAREMALEPKREIEKEQKELAHTFGLDKYLKMDERDARKYMEGVQALSTLGWAMQQSVEQNKSKGDWAIAGGIASGIAGPGAGLAAALDTMKNNAQIEAENAARQEWGRKQNVFYQSLAAEAAARSPHATNIWELKSKYEADDSWSPDTLFSLLDITTTGISVDEACGAITVRANWKQSDTSLCIDGAIRAKLYTGISGGECVGCAYLVLPKGGTVGFKGTLEGVCAEPVKSGASRVVYEPVDLWELVSVSNKVQRKTDGLTREEHQAIVKKKENDYLSEVRNR